MSRPPEQDQVLLTAGEVAKILRIHKVTVYRWAEEGRIPTVRLGKETVRFRREDIDAMLTTEPPVAS